MHDRFSAWAQDTGNISDFLIGQRVRIQSGMLEGIEAVIAGFRPSQRFLLTLDGLPQGVHVIVGRDTIERAGQPVSHA